VLQFIRDYFAARVLSSQGAYGTGEAKRIAEGKLKDRDKMFMRLGRIEASHPQVADLYENGDQGQQEGMTSR
jgi:hypothetical protein